VSDVLAGLKVVEVATEIAGPYCGKLFVELCAEVHKLEPPQGDPLRWWGPFPGGTPDPQRSGLFAYLNDGKQCRTIDPDSVRELLADADVLIDDLTAEQRRQWGLDPDRLTELNPRLVVARISDFGQQVPPRPTTPLTMQAATGWVNMREFDRTPVQAGGRIPEYIAGGYAALGALTALRSREGGRPVEVDVSVFESLLSTLPYPMLLAERLKSMGLPTNTKAAPMLGIVRAADGWVGINCLTGQHWLDVCAMVGLPEFGEHQIAIMLGGPERDEFFAKAQPWLDTQTVADIVELGQAMRIPTAPVSDGASILDCPQYDERGFFVTGGGEGWSFRRPGPPFRFGKTTAAQRRPTRGQGEAKAPFAGVKVFDLSTFWAGAYLTCYLGAFGADVVKVESIQRPDAHRYSGALLRTGDDWYERGPLWQGTNLNKRDLTLDLSSERGREIALRMAAEADVVVENFSPRVVEQFGLDYESLKRVNPDVIMVRMPGFGLEGPWRDYVGWALNIEQLAGMSAVTGYPDGPPCNLQGPADPIAGVHAGVALLAALDHRDRTGEGQLIEVAQIEVGAAITAEPVIEYSLNGTVTPREGNRHRHYCQGVYPTSTEDDWVALSVRDDTDWVNLADLLGVSASDERFATTDARRGNHDAFDELVAGWTSARTAQEAVELLRARGVPAERVLVADDMYDVEHLNTRGYYESVEHPITGVHRYPGWPFRISDGPEHHHRMPPPLLGQHNREILTAAGLSEAEIAELEQAQVIGNRLLNG